MRIRSASGHYKLITTISIPIDREGTNLPVIRYSFVSDNMKKKLAPEFRSALIAA